MSRKVLLGHLCTALFLAGCATVREEPAPPAPAASAPMAKPKPAASPTVKKKKPRTVSQPAPPKPRTPATASNRAELPAMIGSGASWTSPGFQSLAVKRGTPSVQQPVPLFRQASTLAAVRATLADSPARPQAEFRNGVLTLTFDRGSNEEIASAVNKTLSVTGSRSLQVALHP